MQVPPPLLALGGPNSLDTQSAVSAVTRPKLEGEQGRKGWTGAVCRVLLQQNTFFQCWNLVSLIFFPQNCTILVKQEVCHALQNESFSDCGINLTETCQLFSPTIEEEPKLYSQPPVPHYRTQCP